LLPTADDIKGIESEALKAANEFHARLAEQQSQAQLEIQKRQAAVASGTLSAEEKTRAAVDIAKQQAQEQWKQGQSATTIAAAQPGGISAGEVSRLPDADRAKMDAYLEGADNIQKLHLLFNKMVAASPLTGGVQGVIPGFQKIADLTSPEARAYHAYVESSLIPIARGTMGDAATTAGRENVQVAMTGALPTDADTVAKGGQLVYQMLDRNLQNMMTMRESARKTGFDTSPYDSRILDAQHYLNSPEVQQYNPFKTNPIVQVGNSDQANATIANATAGANAGVQVQNQPVQQPQGQAGAYQIPPGYTPQQPPQPSYGRQSAQAAGAAAGGALKTAGSVIGGGLTSTGELAGGLGATINWLGAHLPENWPQQAFQQPRPWETTSQQFVGNQ
jgi:hypothetical protein